MGGHSELEAEQAHVDRAYERLDELRVRTRELLASVLAQGHGGTHQFREERDVIVRTSLARLEQLDVGDQVLCFGRIDRLADHDLEHGVERFHIGRLGVSSEELEPLVVDWRAPVAEPFYRATGRDPMGLVLRRHLAMSQRRVVGYEDEHFPTPRSESAEPGARDHRPSRGAAADGPRSDATATPGVRTERGGHSEGGGGPQGELEEGLEAELGGPAALLAAIGTVRSGHMRDIVATIQQEQDEIIRSPLPGVLVVQGGPGTGKTAVALHRAAYLLYTHRFPLERQGVLVVGPNPLFLRYIEHVLPSLGESGVTLSTVSGLVRDVQAKAEEPFALARLKGEARMAKVIARAVRSRQRPLRVDAEIPYGATVLRLEAATSEVIVAAARRRPGTHNARRRFVEQLAVRHLAQQYIRALEVHSGSGRWSPSSRDVPGTDVTGGAVHPIEDVSADPTVAGEADPPVGDESHGPGRAFDTNGPGDEHGGVGDELRETDGDVDMGTDGDVDTVTDGDEPRADTGGAHGPADDDRASSAQAFDLAEFSRRIRRVREYAEALDRVWPRLSAEELLHDLFGSRPLTGLASKGLLAARERASLYRPRSRTLADIQWTQADLALIDEARILLGSRRARVSNGGDHDEAPRTYGHIVVDEAQDLSPMQLRMITRRSLSGSVTAVGDIGQATGPWAPRTWEDVTAHVPANRPSRTALLTVSYRTPAEIVKLAGRVLAETAPDLDPPIAVRRTGEEPRFEAAAPNELASRVAAVAEQLVAEVSPGTTAVLSPASLVGDLARALDGTGVASVDPRREGLGAPLSLLPVDLANGLEFDAVVLVEPASVVEESAQGLRALYMALTRPTRRLAIVHSRPLPGALRG